MSDFDIMKAMSEYNREVAGSDSGTSDKTPSERFLAQLEDYGFDMTDLSGVLKTKGVLQILSCAGSGKTTTLIFKIMYDNATGELTRVDEINGNAIRSTEKVWVSTFLKSGAEELRSSMWKWQRRLSLPDISSSIRFSTLHSEFMRLLNSLGVATNFVDTKKNNALLKTAVNSLGFFERQPNSEQIRSLSSALTYTRNRLDSARYHHEVYRDMNLMPDQIDSIVREWAAGRRALGLVDFEDLQDYLYELAVLQENPDVVSAIENRYKYLYVDEFQDTSQIQYALLKVYARKAKKIIVIGDDDQTIYTWRGSSNEIITTDFKRDFNPTMTDLSINYRCPENVLNPIIPSIERNQNRLEKGIVAKKSGGTFRIGEYGSYHGMVHALARGIEADVAAGKSVAVLCRENVDGLVPSLLLDKLGSNIRYSISGDNMTLDSYVGRQILGILNLFTSSRNEAVERAISQLVFDRYKVRMLMDELRNTRTSIWDIDMDELRYSIPEVYGYVKRWRAYLETHTKIATVEFVLNDYRMNVYSRNTQYNEICRSVIDAVLALINSYNYDSPQELLYDVEDINDRLKARKKLSGSDVQISTVHNFKGKEADSVYVWNDSNGVFPSKRTNGNVADLEEERRIHYIACTRALETSTILYRKGQPSPFIGEMDIRNAEKFIESGIGGSLKLKSRLEEDEHQEEEDELDFSGVTLKPVI